MPADLIVYALVAAGLVFWLRSILGTRHGDERNRPNPYIASPENAAETAGAVPALPGAQETSSADKIRELAQNPTRVLAVDNKNAENGLLEIARADKTFDINEFLNASQEAFALIVESFGDGDRDMLRELLAPPVFNAFDGAIREREKNGETMKTEIHAIRRAEVIDAGLDKGRNAFITVRFRAEETSVVYDGNGEIISGNPDKVTEMRDVWVFGRDIRSRSPAWLVLETRGDVEGDNETIPNTDQ